MFSCAPLVVRFGMLDDMVLLTPLLRLLHRRYGQPCRVIGSGRWLEPLLAGHPERRRTDLIALDEVLLAWHGIRTWSHASTSPDLPPDMPL